MRMKPTDDPTIIYVDLDVDLMRDTEGDDPDAWYFYSQTNGTSINYPSKKAAAKAYDSDSIEWRTR